MIKSFLFPDKLSENVISSCLFVLRLVFGLMLFSHGWMKLSHFSEMAPLFLGGSLGLALCVFAEVFCALGVIAGLLYRLALIPLIINMLVAFLMVHKAKLVGEGNGETAFLYLIVFIVLFISGPGKYALDRLFSDKKKD